mmetsp:Transcript_38616/g.96373  ORF Transcript_38616/g.96373 Transcript_38616/m.96373 type:complete len:248 (-) Transcript_38616:99-842(-)
MSNQRTMEHGTWSWRHVTLPARAHWHRQPCSLAVAHHCSRQRGSGGVCGSGGRGSGGRGCGRGRVEHRGCRGFCCSTREPPPHCRKVAQPIAGHEHTLAAKQILCHVLYIGRVVVDEEHAITSWRMEPGHRHDELANHGALLPEEGLPPQCTVGFEDFAAEDECIRKESRKAGSFNDRREHLFHVEADDGKQHACAGDVLQEDDQIAQPLAAEELVQRGAWVCRTDGERLVEVEDTHALWRHVGCHL